MYAIFEVYMKDMVPRNTMQFIQPMLDSNRKIGTLLTLHSSCALFVHSFIHSFKTLR